MLHKNHLSIAHQRYQQQQELTTVTTATMTTIHVYIDIKNMQVRTMSI